MRLKIITVTPRHGVPSIQQHNLKMQNNRKTLHGHFNLQEKHKSLCLLNRDIKLSGI